MVQIELWWKIGKGVTRFIRKHRTPMFVVFLKDRSGNVFPIYENHNFVEEGVYEVKGLCPYRKPEDNILNLGSVHIKYGASVEHIVIEHVMFSMFCFGYDDDRGVKYLQKKEDKICRPFGWNENTAEKLLADFNRYN